MKYALYFVPLLFLGCGVSEVQQKVKNFTSCYVHKMPAPFWICYKSPFLSVGKVKAKKDDLLKKEEAYSLGLTNLIDKLRKKTDLLLKKLKIKNKNILENVKNFVMLNASQKDFWFDKNENFLYSLVTVDKDKFKKFLFSALKSVGKKEFESGFNEVF